MDGVCRNKKKILDFKKSLKHALWRIRQFKNWYILFWPLNRIKGQKIIKFRDGSFFVARDIYEKGRVTDYSILNEVWTGLFENYGDISDAKVILNVGAHVGATTLYFAKHSNAKIFDFEPEADNFNQLKKNIETNNLGHRVFAFHQAVWKENGKVKLIFNRKNRGGCSIANCKGDERFEAPAVTLETIIEQNGLDDTFLKLDAQGAEWEILSNTPKETFSKIRSGTIELNGADVERMENLLHEMGFQTKRTGKSYRPSLYFKSAS